MNLAVGVLRTPVSGPEQKTEFTIEGPKHTFSLYFSPKLSINARQMLLFIFFNRTTLSPISLNIRKELKKGDQRMFICSATLAPTPLFIRIVLMFFVGFIFF
jgi:hypothetical protein